MRILLLSGSPRKKGNTHFLVQSFIDGAESSHNSVTLIDVADLAIGPCRACGYCGREESRGICFQQDDMPLIYNAWREAEAVVLATPLYFYNFSAQLKAVIDRTCALPNPKTYGGRLAKMGLLVACQAKTPEPLQGIIHTYHSMRKVFGLEDGGIVIAYGVHKIGEVEGTPVLDATYAMGKSFHG